MSARSAWLAVVIALGAGAALAQDPDPRAWAVTAARGAFDLCRADAPDAAAVAEHGEIWGWPRFVPYLEHLTGFKREAGGQSRRTDAAGDLSAMVELGVQSGEVTSAAPADIRFFRCDVAADQLVNRDLEAYFTGVYGAPAAQSDEATVWLVGKGAAPGPDAAASDEAALAATVAGGPGASVTRIELTRRGNLDKAKLTIFTNGAS